MTDILSPWDHCLIGALTKGALTTGPLKMPLKTISKIFEIFIRTILANFYPENEFGFRFGQFYPDAGLGYGIFLRFFLTRRQIVWSPELIFISFICSGNHSRVAVLMWYHNYNALSYSSHRLLAFFVFWQAFMEFRITIKHIWSKGITISVSLLLVVVEVIWSLICAS